MACISPMSVQRPNGNGRTDRVTVPCGNCVGCLSKKRMDWSFRLKQELKRANTAYFVTITYQDDKIPENGSLNKTDVQLFLKRLRQSTMKVDKTIKLRFFLTGEYGSESLRPHYHMIIFNLPFMQTVAPERMLIQAFLEKSWQNGLVNVGNVTEASIMYTTKYMLKGSAIPPGCVEPFSLMSRNPGLGYEYVKRMLDWHKNTEGEIRPYSIDQGQKKSLPRYMRNKIFEKSEILQINEKNENYVNEKYQESYDKCMKTGENPFQHKLEENEQMTQKSKFKKVGKI